MEPAERHTHRTSRQKSQSPAALVAARVHGHNVLPGGVPHGRSPWCRRSAMQAQSSAAYEFSGLTVRSHSRAHLVLLICVLPGQMLSACALTSHKQKSLLGCR